LSSNFGNLISSMDSLLWIADQVLWASVGATVLILGLLIALFLRDRRHEIGTYIALGEKKSRILFQILSEVLSVSAIAIALSLVSGTLISSTLSRQMLQQDLAERVHEQAMLGMANNAPQALEMFYPENWEMLMGLDNSINGYCYREIQMLKKLKGAPNIVPIIDSDVANKFYMMPYADINLCS